MTRHLLLKLTHSIFLALMSIMLKGCGTVVPHVEEVWEGNQATLFESNIKSHVYCEVQQAIEAVSNQTSVSSSNGSAPARVTKFKGLPPGWGVQLTLSFQIDETGALNPGLSLIRPLSNMQSYTTGLGGVASSQATRIDKYEFYYNVDELKGPETYGTGVKAHDCNQNSNSSFLSGDLRIKEWLINAVFMEGAYPSSRQTDKTDSAFKQDVLSYETKFIVVTSGSISPQWKLVRVATNQGSAPFFSENRTRTHDLIVTFGPSQKPGKPGTVPKAGEGSEPATITSNSHLASEIGLAVSSQLGSRLLNQ